MSFFQTFQNTLLVSSLLILSLALSPAYAEKSSYQQQQDKLQAMDKAQEHQHNAAQNQHRMQQEKDKSQLHDLEKDKNDYLSAAEQQEADEQANNKADETPEQQRIRESELDRELEQYNERLINKSSY